MASSVSSLETPPEVWSGLSRLRDLSRLLLDAIERDDLDAILRLSQEGERLAEELRVGLDPEVLSVVPPEARERLDDYLGMNRLILERLQERREEIRVELEAVRRTKGRLRSLKLHDAPDASWIDRTT